MKNFENAELVLKNALFMDYIQHGIEVCYSKNEALHGKPTDVSASAENATKIFKYAKDADTAEELLKAIKSKGFYAYKNGSTVWVKISQANNEVIQIQNHFSGTTNKLHSVILD